MNYFADQDKVKLGKGAKIDPTALIGAVPLRKTANLKAVVGKDAVCLSGSVIYLGCKIGDGLILGHHAIIREECRIGNKFRLWYNSVVDYGVKIGSNVKIHNNCYIAQYSVIEDDCFIAPGVIFSNDVHPGCKYAVECMKGPIIKKGAQIGCNATILPGVVVGRDAIIGAGSVVVKDVPVGKIVCGNPARVIKSVSDIECTLFPGKKYQKSSCHCK